MYVHETQLRVRYSETDKMGYVYYGNYAQYFEVGRVEWLRSLDISYQLMEDEQDIMLPVTRLDIRFVRPAYYDELITIRTSLNNLPNKFITFETEIFNSKGKLVVAGKARLTFLDKKIGKTIPMPPFLANRLNSYFEKI